jgi:hypothetical protein
MLTSCKIVPKEEGKGRTFEVSRIATLRADKFVETKDNITRPVWAMFAGSQSALRPFMANLRLGRPAGEELWGKYRNRIEFLKSISWVITYQKEDEGWVATINHPDFFLLDPGMVDPDGIKFILLTQKIWEIEQNLDYASAEAHLILLGQNPEFQKYLPVACLFAAYLDRRSRCPLVLDPNFYLQLFIYAMHVGFISTTTDHDYWHRYSSRYSSPHGLGSEGLVDLGATAYSVLCTHKNFETLLAEQVDLYYKVTRNG